MAFQSLLALLTIAVSTVAFGAPVKPVQVIHAKNLKSALKGAPGRAPLPIAKANPLAKDSLAIKVKPRLASTLPPKKSRSVASHSLSNEPLSNYVRPLSVGWMSPTPLLSSTNALAVGNVYLLTSAEFLTDAWTNSGEVKIFMRDQPVQLVGFDLATNLAVFWTGANTRMDRALALSRLHFDSKVMTALLGRTTGSGDQAAELIHQIEQRPLMALSSTVLSSQAAALQDRWTTAFFDATKKGSSVHGLDCGAESLHVDDLSVAAELVRTKLVHCHDTNAVSITRDYAMGFDFLAGDVSFVNNVKAYLAADTTKTTVFSSQALGDRAIASINLLTSPECERSDVLNKQGRHMHVRFCTSALKNSIGLSDTTMTEIGRAHV